MSERHCSKFQFWLMEHNPAECFDDWKDKIWTFIIWPFFRCHECYDGYYYPQYGTAPHTHGIEKAGEGRIALTTRINDKATWPDEYDDVDDGCGIWYCRNAKCPNSNPKLKGAK